jgi:hypothetical protein
VGPVADEVCGAEAEQSAPGRGTCGTTEGPFGKSAYDAVEGPPPHEVTRGTVKVLAVHVPANPLAMLARTQASTSVSLQQVVEGLCPWTAADRKHRSKDWPIFDGQGLNYIAWKREWKAHHKENYPRLKVDALRVLVEQRLWPQTRIASGTSHLRIRSGSTWIGPT